MDSFDSCDVAICGAGPVGAALALMLSRHLAPQRVVLIDTSPAAPGLARSASHPASADPSEVRAPAPDTAGHAPDAYDPRTLALNHGSRQLLEPLGAWPDEAADILSVHVSQQGRAGVTRITHEAAGVPRLGSVVRYGALRTALHTALASSGVRCLVGRPDLHVAPDHVELTVSGLTIRAAVAVRADGLPQEGRQHVYRQHALLATVRASRPAFATAYERFTRQGPLALLPHPAGGGHYAVVWCVPPEQADTLQAHDGPAFAQALQAAFGDRLGRLHLVSARHVLPLSLQWGVIQAADRIVAIGNAAQTLHPVAGQGLNLGLRDARQLADFLADPDTLRDPAIQLARYARQRLPDRGLSAALTDSLPRAFATGIPLVEHLCGLALIGLDVVPGWQAPLRNQLLAGLRR